MVAQKAYRFEVDNNVIKTFLLKVEKLQNKLIYLGMIEYQCILGCANKNLDGFFGPLCKFIEYCRIVALLPVIPLGIMNNW